MSASLDEPLPAAIRRRIELAGLVDRPQGATVEWPSSNAESRRGADAGPLPPAASAGPAEGGDLLATASHEIRTPMYGLLGMIDMTLATELTATQRHFMTLARASAASLATLVNDLLDLSKLQAGHFTVTRTRCDLHRLLDESLGIFSMRAASRNIAFLLSCPADLPQWIDIDSTRMLQVLSNLVGNAIKFTSQGHVGVTVDIEQVHGHPRLRLSVCDTGPGIAPADLARIFQPFAQFHGASSGTVPNTGLGLTITRGIIGAMGGQARVSSEPGAGSCFEAMLPVGLHPPGSAAASALRATVALCTEREFDRRQYAQWLSALGCVCVTVEEAHLADAIVCDGPLPSALRRDLPRVVLVPAPSAGTAWAGDTLGEAASSARSVSVHKPLSPWRLRGALCHVLGRAGLSARAAPESAEWSRLAGTTVLLVDDDAVSVMVTQGMLEMVGVRVTSTSNGMDAVRVLSKDEFDMVLTDLRLPVMDGHELSLWIRDAERRRPAGTRSAVIALSASTAPAERQRCLDVGMDDFVAKPVLREHLYAVLLRHAQKREPQSPTHFFVNTSYDLDG
jgi:signal transduction histidine kinase/CheY-like chemotaxis protein